MFLRLTLANKSNLLTYLGLLKTEALLELACYADIDE